MRRRALVAAVALLAAAAPAAAATNTAVFGLRAGGDPKLGYFVYRLTPGASTRGTVIVSNVGGASGTVKLYAADATTGSTSGTVYRTDRRPAAAGTWLSLGASRLTLAPGAHATVPFTMRVPAGAPAGQWVAGIVAESPQTPARSSSGGRSSIRIRVRDLTIVGVEVDVPGAAGLGFHIGGVHTGGARGYQQLFVRVADSGGLLSRPTGRVVVADAAGRTVERLPFAMDTFLPQTAIDYPLLLHRALGPGAYRASVELRARPLRGGPGRTVVRATRTFRVSSRQVRKVFASAPPTRAPAAGGGGSSAAAAAGGAAGALVLAGAAMLLVRRRRPATS